MNAVLQQILERDITKLFGFDELSDDEKRTLLDDLGSTLIESATLRFVVESEEEQVEAFENTIDQHKDADDMLVKIIEAFPRFGELLQEEVASFKKEAVEVLGS